jgi:hypothetical protein
MGAFTNLADLLVANPVSARVLARCRIVTESENSMQPFQNSAVKEVFDAYPAPMRLKLMVLRQLIFDTAARTEGVGELEEALKWGEPAYLTSQSKSGSTVRFAYSPKRPLQYAMYFNCQTTLVDTFRTVFPSDFQFDGNRALVFKQADRLPKKELAWCIAEALTYHQRQQKKGG